MPEITSVVGSSAGLHARPAATFVRAVVESGMAVTITKEGRTINAASLLAVLALGASHGTTVTLATDNDTDAARDTLRALADLIESELDQ